MAVKNQVEKKYARQAKPLHPATSTWRSAQLNFGHYLDTEHSSDRHRLQDSTAQPH